MKKTLAMILAIMMLLACVPAMAGKMRSKQLTVTSSVWPAQALSR